jgi:catechol 2,3-dioxygenase-like lactoylglutathione lyase family enzyme
VTVNDDALSHSNSGFQIIERPEPIVRADAVAHVVFARRDTDAMARFLQDFGFRALENPDGVARYFRGYGTLPFCVEVIPASEDGFIGFALLAKDAADLEALAKHDGLQVEACDGPGGGMRVRLTDPDGRRVDLIHGFSPVPALATRGELLPVNSPFGAHRVNQPVRTPVEPAPVFRIGHVVFQSPNFAQTTDWYMRRFGFIPTDVQATDDGKPALGFFRLDRGAEPADHHSLAVLAGPAATLLHVSTETLDIEAVGQGQQFLRARGWIHFWGIGRHLLGSQVFDYWKDPVGDEWEHYSDGDLMTAEYPTGYHKLRRGGLWAWGHDIPDSMRPPEDVPEHAPPEVKALIQALLVPPRPWLR